MSDYSGQGHGFGQQPEEPYGYQASSPQQYGPQQYGGQEYGYPPFVQNQTNGIGVAGFVTGLVGLLLCWVPFFGLVLALLGVSLSGVGIARGNRRHAPKGLAVAGLVLGIIAMVPALLIAVGVAVAVSGGAA